MTLMIVNSFMISCLLARCASEGDVTERALPHSYGMVEMGVEKDAVLLRASDGGPFSGLSPRYASMFVGIDNLLSWPDHEVSLRSRLGW